MRRVTCFLCAAIVMAALVRAAAAQDVPLLDLLVERLGVYLEEYENALGAVVADELYEQVATGPGPGGQRRMVRKLESEVAFLRLPGGADWFGIRDVRSVNGKAVERSEQSLSDVLKTARHDLLARAAAIVRASSRHNLGGARTINMPTVPLEALGAKHHPRFIFKMRGRDRISGVQTQRLDFEEFDEPTIVHDGNGESVWSRGSAWIEAETGRVWRAELIVSPVRPGATRRLGLESRVRVEFTNDAMLGMLVPKELVEDFWIPRGRGTGRARYSNFRRFSTSGRIVPQ